MTEKNGDLDSLLLRSLSETYCGDDHFFRFLGSKKCSFILDKKSAATRRRLNLCKDANINNACKWSCGHCSDSIADDPNFKIVKYNGDEKPCQWIGEHRYWLTRQNRRNKFCSRSFKGINVFDACKLSCGNFDIPQQRQQRRKLGYISSVNATRKSFEHFRSTSSWTYNFETTLEITQGKFADQNGIEYVPMIPKPYLLSKNCEFEEGICESGRWSWNCPSSMHICSVQDVVNAVKEGVEARGNGPRVR